MGGTSLVKPLFHTLQKPTHKLVASAFKYSDRMKVLAASSRVGFCNESKRAFSPPMRNSNHEPSISRHQPTLFATVSFEILFCNPWTIALCDDSNSFFSTSKRF